MEKRLIEKLLISLPRVISLGILFLLSSSFLSCTMKRKCMILPNGEIINATQVKDINAITPVLFSQYKGFVGNLKGTIFQDFTVIIERHEAKIGRDVLNSETIESLKYAKVLSLKSDKIPESNKSFEDIVQHISNSYPRLHKEITTSEEIGIDKEITFLNDKGSKVLNVQYSRFGIPGTFIILNANICEDW